VEELIHKLESLGWRWYSDVLRPHAKSFFKTFDTLTRCNCNSEKAGMQVCCRVYPPHENGTTYRTGVTRGTLGRDMGED